VNAFLNDTDSNAAFKDDLRKSCPQNNVDEELKVLKDLDVTTPDKFDNSYYKNLLKGEGIIRSDQTLWSTPGPHKKLVEAFSKDQEFFFRQFAISTIKMGNIRPLIGKEGEIRKNCRKRNSDHEESLVAVE
jgi:peroxidase